MSRLRFGFALSTLVLLAGGAAAADVKLVYVGEISGSIAVSGGNFRDGVVLAVEEVNAAGGILKDRIALSQLDTQTNPGVARSQMQKAIDGDPYVVLGPIFSGNVKATMQLLQQAEIPHLIGGEAGELTTLGDRYLFAPRSASRSACRRSPTTSATSSRRRRCPHLGQQRFRQGWPRQPDKAIGRA